MFTSGYGCVIELTYLFCLDLHVNTPLKMSTDRNPTKYGPAVLKSSVKRLCVGGYGGGGTEIMYRIKRKAFLADVPFCSYIEPTANCLLSAIGRTGDVDWSGGF